MYTESEKYVPKSKFILFLSIAGLSLGFIASGWIFGALQSLTGLWIIGLCPYVCAAALILFIYRVFIMEYQYTLKDGSLIIERRFRRRRNEVARVRVKGVISLEPWRGGKKPEDYFALRTSAAPMLLRYKNKKEKKELVFAPSEKLAALLMDKE